MRTRLCMLLVFVFLLVAAFVLGREGSGLSTMESGTEGPVFVVDPGHGGEDGGAVSADGLRESELNLAVCLRMDDLFGLFGCPCVLTRDSETLDYPPEARTVRQRKQADLERRVKLAGSVSNGILVSVHQNKYPSAGPHGAQVLYRDEPLSIHFAELTQGMLLAGLGKSVRPPAAIPDSIYLMRKVECPAILVECGFISNPEELSLLRSEAYQTRIALCLVCACLEYANEWERENGQGSQG